MSGVDLSNVGIAEVAAFVSLAGTVTAWLMWPGKAAGKAVGELATNVAKVEERVTALEGEMKHLPDKDTSHRLELAITRLEGRFDALGERLKPVAAIADRLQEVMIEQQNRGH